MNRHQLKRHRLFKRVVRFIERRQLYRLSVAAQWKSPRCHLAAAFLTDYREHRRRYP